MNNCNFTNGSSSFPTTLQLQQETLLHAFKEAQSSSSSVANSTTSTIPISNTAHATQNGIVSYRDGGGGVSKERLRSTPGLYTQSMTTTIDNDNNVNNCNNEQNKLTMSQAQQNWLTETMNIIPTLDPSNYMGQYSPTYTSKSFDDMHQFIGSDCPPASDGAIDTLNETGKTTSIIPAMKGPATAAADELNLHSLGNNNSIGNAYALFAQQSVEAVCKHSAYSSTSRGNNEKSKSIIAPLHSSLTNELPIIPMLPVLQSNHALVPLNEIPDTHQSVTTILPKVERIDSTIKSHVKNVDSILKTQKSPRHSTSTSLSATFSAANLRRHLKVASEDVVQTSATTSTKFDSKSLALSHATLVSGSERSSSYNGNESASAVGSRSSGSSDNNSGSDNSSDNSDAASDEGRRSSPPNSTRNDKSQETTAKRHSKEIHGTESSSPSNTKRQKVCVKDEESIIQ
jgi:hypothetical protein